jgi:hypothetical protein
LFCTHNSARVYISVACLAIRAPPQIGTKKALAPSFTR